MPKYSEPKKCSKCAKALPLSAFTFTKPGYLRGKCRSCQAKYDKAYRGKNPEKSKRQWAQWISKNRDKLLSSKREYRNSEHGKRMLRLYAGSITPSKRKAGKLKYLYGITLEQFAAMMLGQKERCKICGKHRSENLRNTLYVDHCHRSKKVRGLLCQKCNSLLGLARENTRLLRGAIKYLELS